MINTEAWRDGGGGLAFETIVNFKPERSKNRVTAENEKNQRQKPVKVHG